MDNTFRLTILAASLSAVFYSFTAQAEQGTDVTASPGTKSVNADDAVTLDKVTVTAQKRAELLQDVPISITVLDGDVLEKAHIHSLFDLQQKVPNFEAVQAPGFSYINIRGVGGGGRNIGWDTRVGVYLDGVYIGQTQALEQPLNDIEQVEILRGPQGHLFGRNTDAGAVSITTRAPSKEFEASIKAGISNYNGKEVAASVSGPLSEAAQAKLFISSETRDGFIKNQLNGNDFNDLNRLGLRGQVSMQPSEKLKIDLYADYSKIDQELILGQATTTLQGQPLPGGKLPSYTTNIDYAPYRNADLFGVSANINYALDSGNKLTSITAYRDTKHKRGNDTDNLPLDLLRIDYKEHFKQTSQEFRLTSPDTGDLRYVAGVYLLNEKASTDRRATVGKDTNARFRLFVPAFGVFINLPFGAYYGVTPGSLITNNGSIETTNVALFGNIDYKLTQDLTLNLGARYTHENKKLNFNLDGSQSGRIGIATLSGANDNLTENHISPSAGLTYALNADTNLYGKFSTGFKSGGWNTDFLTTKQVAKGYKFDTETVNSFEIGIKGDALNHRVQYDLAVFDSKFKDYQVFQSFENTLFLRNAAKVDSRGLEASARWGVSSDLSVGANLALLSTKYNSFPGGGLAGADLSGMNVADTPRVTVALNASYGIPVASLYGKFVLAGDVNFRGDVVEDPAFPNTNPSRTLANASLSYIHYNGKWSANLWVRNLTDKEFFIANVTDILGNTSQTPGTPRTYGITAKYDF